VTADDLAKNADSFFAIKALCFLISDLETTPWRAQSFTQGGISQGHRYVDRKNPQGADVENEFTCKFGHP